jgi:isopentenyl diphosphate isomerase/L-lactate dehydrogenase-like FMN-dependent dehydrogenase
VIPLTVDDYEALARGRMERSAYDYYAGGAGDERTLAANRAAFDRIQLRPRVLVDVSAVDTATSVLGQAVELPVLLAPTAFNRLAHPDGELAAARAARAAGTVMIGSTLSTCALEDVASACGGGLWFQLYVYKDRAMTQELVARAERCGYQALVLTVDTPLLGRRYRDVRNNFVLPEGISMKNFEAAMTNAARWGAHSSFSAYVHDLFDATLTWSAVEWLRAQTRLPILLKGILTAEDAEMAVRAGASGIIVSNHGGRQLDGALASIDALPEVVAAVAGRAEVLMDGGIRRGTDILKALALGARAVCIGRPYLWALAADGEDGVRSVLRLLREELALAMALSGRPTVAAIDRSLVERHGGGAATA